MTTHVCEWPLMNLIKLLIINAKELLVVFLLLFTEISFFA